MITVEDIVAAGESLEANPRAWSELSANEQTVLRAIMPQPSFTPLQRAWMATWWMACTAEQVAELNATTDGMRIEPREDVNGNLFVGADLLSDALDNRTISECLPILEQMTLHRKADSDWPKTTITWG